MITLADDVSQQTGGLCGITPRMAKTSNAFRNRSEVKKQQGRNCSRNPLLEAQPLEDTRGHHICILS